MGKVTAVPCQLEIDHDRGVIYVHVTDPDVAEQLGVVTRVRICRLSTPIPDKGLLDITHMYGTSWTKSTQPDPKVMQNALEDLYTFGLRQDPNPTMSGERFTDAKLMYDFWLGYYQRGIHHLRTVTAKALGKSPPPPLSETFQVKDPDLIPRSPPD